MRPGVDVTSRAEPLPRSAPTDTGPGFLIGNTATGLTPPPPDVKLVRSLTEYIAVFGDRTGGDLAYDAAEAFFREGGNVLTVSRSNPGTTRAAKAAKEADAAAQPNPNVVDPTIQAALDALGKDLGPGQVFIAHASAAQPANQSALLQHAAGCNRVALLSLADGDASSLQAAVATLRSDTNA